MSRCFAEKETINGIIECDLPEGHLGRTHQSNDLGAGAIHWAREKACPEKCEELHPGREHAEVVSHSAVANAVKQLLFALGVDEGDHTADTPNRVAKAWAHQLAGYDEEPAVHLRKTFSAPEYPGIIIVSGIKVQSTCAHHLLPITGWATVAYRPHPRTQIVGLSKLSRVVDGFARRLQVQERIGAQVVDALEQELSPAGGACIITAAHGCMTIRGVQEHEALTTTTSVTGEWTHPGSPELAEVYATHRASRP